MGALKVHHLRPAPGAKRPRPEWAVVRPARARPPAAAPRARRLATRCRLRSRVGRCRCMRLPKLKGFKN